MKDDMIVRAIAVEGDAVVEVTRALGDSGLYRRRNGKAARHAEMDEKDLVAIERDQEIFRASSKTLHAATGKAFGETGGKGKAQIRPALLDRQDPPSFQNGKEAASDRFDFGQFRHRAGISYRRRRGGFCAGVTIGTVALMRVPRYGPRHMSETVDDPKEQGAVPSDLPSQETASFGFAEVPARDKSRLVRGVFESVAERYDIMNDLMSGGLHRAWKDAVIDWLAPPTSARPFDLLDVAGGTGDISVRFLKRAGVGARAMLTDINEAMLRAGLERADRKPFEGRLAVAVADAEHLPFPDRSFDAYTIAFGIRNVTNMDNALAEARRVLKPGGRFLCLEFSHLAIAPLKPVYDAYSFHAIPRIGQWVAGDSESYRYLVESIRRFPDQDSFAERIAQAGLGQVKYRNLTGGVAAIHSAWRL